MGTKPNFRSNAVSKVDLSSTLQRGAIVRMPEPLPVETRPALEETPTPIFVQKQPVAARKKKLAHLKTLLEYDEKKEITGMLREIADVVGHNIQFSIFNRGLLLAALAQKDELIRAAEKAEGLVRPSNGDVDAFRHYEGEIAKIIFRAFDIRNPMPKRLK